MSEVRHRLPSAVGDSHGCRERVKMRMNVRIRPATPTEPPGRQLSAANCRPVARSEREAGPSVRRVRVPAPQRHDLERPRRHTAATPGSPRRHLALPRLPPSMITRGLMGSASGRVNRPCAVPCRAQAGRVRPGEWRVEHRVAHREGQEGLKEIVGVVRAESRSARNRSPCCVSALVRRREIY